MQEHVEIFTDGACSGNPGPGGWGAILRCNGLEKELSGGEKNTTNNRMELTAAIRALQALKRRCTVTLTTDSQYLCNAINQGWLTKWKKNNWMRNSKDPVLNVDLWKELSQLLEEQDVTFFWVKGHAGHPENERCDALATGEIKKW